MSNEAKRYKRLFAGVLAGALALSVTPILGFTGVAGAAHIEATDGTGDGNVCEDAPATDPFTDVSDTDPAVDEIRCMVNTDPPLTQGKTATTYEPNSSTLRGQMALFLERLADLAEANETSEDAVQALPAGDGETPFTDISDWPEEHQQAIDRLEEAGITSGVTATEFRPGDPVSRRQMARFIVNLQDYLAGEDFAPTATEDYFDDDNGDSGEDVLNILAEEGVFIGTSATGDTHNVQPGANITRRQMAFVVTRKLEVLFEAGLIGRLFAEDDGVSGTVVSCGAGTLDFDTAEGETVTAAFGEDDDTFTVDGASASAGAFEDACSVGDEVTVQDSDDDGDFDVFSLMNEDPPTSGTVGAVGLDTNDFSIITAAGSILETFTYGDADETYTVNGTAVPLSGFEAALSLGDTIVTGETGTPDGDPETFALTNGNWDGAVGDITETAGVEVTFTADSVGDDPDLGADDTEFSVTAAEVTGGDQTLTVDGEAATYGEFEDALSEGDTVVYSRAGGVETFALTNVEVDASFAGITDDNTNTGTDDVGVIAGDTQFLFDYVTAGVTTFIVDGTVVTIDEFEDALDEDLAFAESISYNEDTDTLTLTTTNDSGVRQMDNVVSDNGVYDGGDMFDIVTADGLVIATISGGTAYANDSGDPVLNEYFVNGVEVTEGVFVDYLDDIDEDGTGDADAGDDFQLVITATDAEHRLTTNNSLTD